MISVNNLTKKRGSATILQNLSFQVKSGRVTGFLGPNGAGKSSTIRILLGLDQATSGNALINGIPYIKLKNPLYTVGAVLDGSGAHPARTGRNLLWPAKIIFISSASRTYWEKSFKMDCSGCRDFYQQGRRSIGNCWVNSGC